MNKFVARLILIAIAVISAPAAEAVEANSLANLCPRGQEHWVCSEAFTRLDPYEAAFSDKVDVAAYFIGPGYYWEASDSKVPNFFIPSTWQARVVYDSTCGYSGLHSVEALHRAWAEDPDGVLLVWDEQNSYGYYYNPYCDCQSEIP